MGGVGGDGERAGEKSDDKIKGGEEKISKDEKVARFDNDGRALMVHRVILAHQA